MDAYDPRLRPGAYITDGGALFYVVRILVPYGQPTPAERVYVEDCQTLEVRQYSVDTVREQFRLVRTAATPSDGIVKAA
jgi:hypothetical protein